MRKVLTIICLIVLPVLASANTSIGGGIVANITPENPGPNQQVTVKLESYSVDLDRSLITWYINNQKIASDIGQKTLTNQVGRLGEIGNWLIVVETPLGQQISGTIVFNPATVNLLWQANTYVPTWYLGKALPSPNSQVKILALSEIEKTSGQLYKNSELVYNWYKNGKFLSVSSGVGKDHIIIDTNNDFTPTNIEVRITSLDQLTTANGSLEIKNYNSKLLIFPQNNSLSHYPFGEDITITDDSSLTAEPFYFSLSDLLDKNLIFNWQLNNKSVAPDDNNPNNINLNLRGVTGPADLKLEVKNKRSFFQSATYQGIIKSASKSNLFGL